MQGGMQLAQWYCALLLSKANTQWWQAESSWGIGVDALGSYQDAVSGCGMMAERATVVVVVRCHDAITIFVMSIDDIVGCHTSQDSLL